MVNYSKSFKKALIFCWLIVLFAQPFHSVYAAEDVNRKTGEWQQFVWDEGKWRYIGVFLVYEQNNIYMMKPVDQVKSPDITNSLGLFDVSFTKNEWVFNSDWGNGNIGTFRLKKIAPGIYEGWSYFKDKQLQRNVWILIK